MTTDGKVRGNKGIPRDIIEHRLKVYSECGCNSREAARRLRLDVTTVRNTLTRAANLDMEVPKKAPIEAPFSSLDQETEWQTIRQTVREDGSVTSTTVRPRPNLVPLDVPGPRRIKFATTVYDREGNPDRQFVRVEPDKAAQDAMWREQVERLCAGLPAVPEIPLPLDTTDDICAEIPIGDHHFGMMAWAKESGEDYDLNIAKRLLQGAIGQLIAQAPKCKLCVIEGLGDFEHYDSFKPVTPTSGHILDSDTRYSKMAETAIDAWIVMIMLALQHFEEVLIIIVGGNHDPVGQTWIRIALARIFRDNPRVRVETSPSDFQYWEFGKCLIGCYHGHTVKMQDLPQIMAQDRRQAWGRTEYWYWRTGHIHHKTTGRLWYPTGGDFGKSFVESFRVLPPADAHAHNQGYRALRDMTMILLHREFGEVGRRTVNPAMLLESEAA